MSTIKVSTGTPSISAMEFRANPGMLLDRVDYLSESFVIERAGKPKAVLVPFSLYKIIEQAKLDLFTANQEIRKLFRNEPPKRVGREIRKAIGEIRNAS